MLLTIAAILAVLWMLCLLSSITLGGFVNSLLLFAIILVLVRLMQVHD